MDKKKLLIIIGGVLLGVFLFFHFTGDRTRKYFNWQENYRIDSKQPYGTYVFYRLLRSHFDDNFTVLESSVANNLSKDQAASLYVLVGESGHYQYQDIDSLLAFVGAGNSAFLASKAFPYDISYEVLLENCGVVSTWVGEEVTMQLEKSDSTYHYEYFVNQKPSYYYWSYLDSLSCTSQLEPLGNFDKNRSNFLRAPYGDGYFYFHTTPLVFTNYYLKKEDLLAYVETLMTYFPNDHIYWDEFSKLPFLENEKQNSPLKFILSQPALQWAWYLLLTNILIYFIFYTKRKQRIIPVLERNSNTSIEFAETMGFLYFREQNHKKIADHQWNLFLSYIRSNYHLHTHVIDDHLIKKVGLKSKIPEEEVQNIFKTYQRLDFKVNISADDLIVFHDMIEAFYHKSK